MASALACVRLFGIDLPAHPTWEEVQAEYETLYQTLDGRPIESLIDLPMMTDPEMQAAMQVLAELTPAAYLTDFRFCCLQMCRMVKISMQYGMSAACAHAYGYWGLCSGPSFTVIAMPIVSPSSGATWSRSMALSLFARGLYYRWGGCLLDAADRDRHRFHAGDLSPRDRDG